MHEKCSIMKINELEIVNYEKIIEPRVTPILEK
jgi:hypothetical protein